MLDSFAKIWFRFKPGKGNYFVAKKGSSFMLIKPTTGMNNSGAIINEVLNFYKAKKEDLVIIFDDVDLPLGEIRFELMAEMDAQWNEICLTIFIKR